MNGYNVVLDTASGSVHTVDEVAYDIIALYKEKTPEEIVEIILERYGHLEDVTREDILECIDDVRTLCEENGITLVLIKAPTNNWKYHWYDEWDEQIVAYAQKHTLPYYNFIGLDDEIGIDWATDTYDAGVHLNVYGAEKLSRYFGAILKEELHVSDLSDDEALSSYYAALARRYDTEKQKGS